MNVNINETGKNSSMMKINNMGTGGRNTPANGNNTATVDQQISGTQVAVRKHHSIFQDILHTGPPLPAPAGGIALVVILTIIAEAVGGVNWFFLAGQGRAGQVFPAGGQNRAAPLTW